MVSTEMRVFLERGKHRIPVLKKLLEDEQVAFLLAKDFKVSRETISRVFKELTEKGLSTCVNPEEHHYRKYRITDLGKKVLKGLD